MDNKKYLTLKKSNCKNCYKCIRNCPVKSIKFSDNQANIIADECVLCGMCFVSCPQNAKEIRNDVGLVQTVLDVGKPVYASVAPSFVAEYKLNSFEPMRKLLKHLGFADAQETAVGAQVVTEKYIELLNKNEQDIIISTCCHSINSLVQKYYPSIVPYMANVTSPMLAHCNMLKQQHPGSFTVFIGPCISKKEEAEIYGIADCVLTFEELDLWMSAEGISLADFTEESEKVTSDNGKLSQLYPITGGILRSMEHKPENYTYIALDGIDNCVEAFKEIEHGNLKKCFIEMSACKGSCVNGPGITNHGTSIIKNTLKIDNYAGKNNFEENTIYDNEYMTKKLDFIGINSKMPGEETILKILAKIGKTKPEHELNCGSCGYNTCREKAIAVYMGKADLNMCLPYLKEKAENFSDNVINNTPNGIFILDEDLNIQQINKAACKFLNIKNQKDCIGQGIVDYLNPTEYITAMASGKKLQQESKKYLDKYGIFIAETIYYDKDYHLLFSIMRDITARESEKRQHSELTTKTVEITDRVIEKQMRIVQEIASLLGETTAETKIALTQLKDTLSQ